MRIRVITGGAALLALGITGAYPQNRIPAECRQEIQRLCGGNRGELRQCLRERASELSQTCRATLIERMRARGGAAGAGRGAQRRPGAAAVAAPTPNPAEEVRYGAHTRQAVDFFPARGAAQGPRPPLILFIHGGGWSFGNRHQSLQSKPAHFTGRGFAFGSIGYRVLPDAPVEEQARDAASAIAAMRAQSVRLGFDPDRIVLMGHSAGAHLAALVATDTSYAGRDFAAIRGVLLLDGAGYDIARQMASGGPVTGRMYDAAFGNDPARQRALSPMSHAAAPNAPSWLILHDGNRAASGEQSRALGAALIRAGAAAEVVAVADTDHGRLNRELGTQGDVATAAVDAFLDRIF